MMAAIDGRMLGSLIIQIVVIGLIFWLLNWLIDYIKLGEPFNKIAKVVLAVVAVVFLINALLYLVGKPFIAF